MLDAIRLLPYVALPGFFHKEQEYRLHTIRTRRDKNGVLAEIYDGEEVIHEMRAANKRGAFERAKEWIDEQDEYEAEFDLHSAIYVH